MPKFVFTSIFINLVSDLGGLFGFGIFSIILSVMGLYVIWSIKKLIIPHMLLLGFILTSFVLNYINVYLNFIAAIFVGYGLFVFIKRKWKVKLIETLTLTLLICGLLFSSLSYTNRISDSLPDRPLIESLEWLGSQPQGKVLTHPSNGLWIEAIAKKPVVIDSLVPYSPDINATLTDLNDIFYSRNLENTKALLDKYNISYIWISPKMKQGQVWTKEEQGLLFLFRNSETFKKTYDQEEIEIWKYLS